MDTQEEIQSYMKYEIKKLTLSILLIWGLSLFGLDKEPVDVDAIVTMNDGSVLSGTLEMIGSNPLTITPLKESRQKQFRLEDIVSIDHGVETADMKKPWVYKESGSTEKFYYDEKEYPFMNFISAKDPP